MGKRKQQQEDIRAFFRVSISWPLCRLQREAKEHRCSNYFLFFFSESDNFLCPWILHQILTQVFAMFCLLLTSEYQLSSQSLSRAETTIRIPYARLCQTPGGVAQVCPLLDNSRIYTQLCTCMCLNLMFVKLL